MNKADLELDGEKEVEGASLAEKVYEFGDPTEDVAKAGEEYAKNMVVLKVEGDIIIEEGVTLTSCKSAEGYGGPKGMTIYCEGTIENRGTISMTARGAKAVGENVYLWKNKDGSYEYVPKEGAAGGEEFIAYTSSKVPGKKGSDGTLRQTGGGGSGALRIDEDQNYGGASARR
ncbi:MAG: hypothetical protein HFJ54_07680 [Clostridia bacterium]|nr:hypothetical protein [Clostridia bacterium]